ncbi:MAG: OmpH family outer membrane protein [Thermodesulfobacteriota bacterium]|nr:OmpH family outer membrane protein [Thermodesulfobacteriota bacterium]
MKTRIMGMVMAALLLFVGSTLWAAEAKIAYVDGQKIINESIRGKNAIKELKQTYELKQQEISKKEQEINRLREEISAQRLTMKEDVLTEMKARYQKEGTELNRFMKDAQEEIKRKQITLFKPISNEIDAVIQSYGMEHGLDLILDKGNPVFLYGSQEIDVTDAILKIYDNQQVKGADKSGQ